jgi:hypothetical protein
VRAQEHSFLATNPALSRLALQVLWVTLSFVRPCTLSDAAAERNRQSDSSRR